MNKRDGLRTQAHLIAMAALGVTGGENPFPPRASPFPPKPKPKLKPTFSKEELAELESLGKKEKKKRIKELKEKHSNGQTDRY